MAEGNYFFTNYEKANISSGDSTAEVELATVDLIRLIKAIIVTITAT